MMRQAWKGGAPVPTPARRVENLLSMRYIGNEAPAPRLHDVRLEAPESFLGTVLAGVDALARAGIVHGDLSAFNVLVDDERAWFIDFSEAVRVDRLGGSPWVRLTEASKLLTRGLQALQLYFRKYNLTIETEPLVEQIVQRLDRFGVLELSALASFTITTQRRADTEDLIARRGWSGIDAETVWEMPTVFIGSVAQIRDDLQARRDRFGLSYLITPDRELPTLTAVIAGL